MTPNVSDTHISRLFQSRKFEPLCSVNISVFISQCNAVDSVDEEKETNPDDEACKEPDDNDDDNDYSDEKEKKESNGNLFTRVVRFITRTIGQRTAIALVLLFLGVGKAMLGCQSLCIAKFGLGGIRTGEQVTKVIRGEEKMLVYNDRMDLVDPKT